MFASKAKSLLLDGNPIKDSTQLGSNIACKYLTRVKVTDSDQHYYNIEFVTAVKTFQYRPYVGYNVTPKS